MEIIIAVKAIILNSIFRWSDCMLSKILLELIKLKNSNRRRGSSHTSPETGAQPDARVRVF